MGASLSPIVTIMTPCCGDNVLHKGLIDCFAQCGITIGLWRICDAIRLYHFQRPGALLLAVQLRVFVDSGRRASGTVPLYLLTSSEVTNDADGYLWTRLVDASAFVDLIASSSFAGLMHYFEESRSCWRCYFLLGLMKTSPWYFLMNRHPYGNYPNYCRVTLYL